MDFEQNLLATMITTTTYGTWLPGDLRGYVDHGRILPGDLETLGRNRMRMNQPTVYLNAEQQNLIFEALGRGAEEFGYELLAVSVESWHCHWFINHRHDRVATMAGRLKNRMRQAVQRGRIWTSGYDKRFCFDEKSVEARYQYIGGHRGCRLR